MIEDSFTDLVHFASQNGATFSLRRYVPPFPVCVLISAFRIMVFSRAFYSLACPNVVVLAKVSGVCPDWESRQ